jgi:hypothetical protein
MSNKFKIETVLEQEGTFDGKWELSIDEYLLMKIINHNAAEDDEDAKEMEYPKKFIVRVIIETKEK